MFKRLAELLTEKEESDGITAGTGKVFQDIGKGVKDVSDRVKKAGDRSKEAEKKLKDAEKEAARAGDAVVKKAAAAEKEVERAAKEAQRKNDAAKRKEEQFKKTKEKETEAAAKTAAAEHKTRSAESIAALRGDIDSFLGTFFDKFPFRVDSVKGVGGAQDIMSKYPTREAALEAFKVFRDLSKRTESLRNGMNTALRSKGKVSARKIEQYEAQADRVVQGGATAIPKSLGQFVRSEARFFKRIFRVNDDFNIDGDDFKDMLALKMNQTVPEKVGDAAQALNMLLLIVSNEFRNHAKAIADVGRTLDDEKGAAAKSARNSALAKTATQAAADEKAIAGEFETEKSAEELARERSEAKSRR